MYGLVKLIVESFDGMCGRFEVCVVSMSSVMCLLVLLGSVILVGSRCVMGVFSVILLCMMELVSSRVVKILLIELIL